jgi:hypothetical protein
MLIVNVLIVHIRKINIKFLALIFENLVTGIRKYRDIQKYEIKYHIAIFVFVIFFMYCTFSIFH